MIRKIRLALWIIFTGLFATTIFNYAYSQELNKKSLQCKMNNGYWIGNVCIYGVDNPLIVELTRNFELIECQGWPEDIIFFNVPWEPHYFYLLIYQPETGLIYVWHHLAGGVCDLSPAEDVGIRPVEYLKVDADYGYWRIADLGDELYRNTSGMWPFLQLCGGLASYEIYIGFGEIPGDIVGVRLRIID